MITKELELHNDINEVPFLGDWIEQVCGELLLPMPETFKLNLALEEAVVNVMNYAYPGKTGERLWLTAEADNAPATTITFTLKDHGVPFDPTVATDPDISLDAEDRPIGGLGIFLIRQTMDSVEYERREDTNVLVMKYNVGQADNAEALL